MATAPPFTTSPPAAVTIVVPCHDEAAGAARLVASLATLVAAVDDVWHVVFVDDGSADGTVGALRTQLGDAAWATIVSHPERRGLGAALRTGFAQARSPVVCSMDADCSYPTERLTELVALVRDGANLATASPWHPDASRSAGRRERLVLSRLASRVYRTILGAEVYTYTSLFRAYDRRMLVDAPARADGFAALAEQLVAVIRAGGRVAEVPMPFGWRTVGASKLRVLPTLIGHARLLYHLAGRRDGRGPT